MSDLDELSPSSRTPTDRTCAERPAEALIARATPAVPVREPAGPGPEPAPPPHHRRRWPWLVLALVVAIVLGFIGLHRWLTAPPRVIGVAEAVDRFHDRTTTSGAAAPALRMPAEGVYVYRGSGTERVDALGGDTHTYPDESTMTVETEGCGYRVSWAPFSGRTETSLLCPVDGGLALQQSTSAHEFFRMSQEERFTCDAGAWWLPPPDTTTWTTVCRSDTRVSTRTARVIGMETVDVGGEARLAIHIRYDDVLSAGSTGTSSTELWLDRETGLVLRQHNEADTTNDTVIGVVTFHERFDLTLQSTAVQR